MANERNTENLVRDLLRENDYLSNENITVEEQSSINPRIDKLLSGASKKGSGKGHPEFIITFANRPNDLIVIECKADVVKHESDTRKKYADFAVDGALNYAAYLKDGFNVMAMAISGETKQEMKVSNFLWIKGKQTYKETSDISLLNPTSLFKVIDEKSTPIREDELIKKAITYNEILHKLSVPEVDRCKLISAILVALQDRAFATGYSEYFGDDQDIEYNPNIDLVDGLIDACKRILKKNKITGSKSEIILREYEGIKQVNAFVSKAHPDNKISGPNRVLRELIDDLSQNVMPYVNSDVFDVLGQFYTQFIRYAGSDSKTGLVLTPPHITDLFCDLAGLTADDIVFDPCCGTSGFLVSAMKYMLNKAGSNNEAHKKIKTNQLIGIEQRADMFAHACSNMMMRGDGKSHIHYGSCFDEKILRQVKTQNPTKAFLNPPYNVGEDGQLEFIENALNVLTKDGVCVAICQMSVTTTDSPRAIAVRERLLRDHTLEAVLSMPDELFNPAGVVSSVLVFRAKVPHPENKRTFFGYFKDDGFKKSKDKGRADKNGLWTEYRDKWLENYVNRVDENEFSVNKKIDQNSEWCAEAYLETNIDRLSEAHFIKSLRDYHSSLFSNEIISSINDGASRDLIPPDLETNKWSYFELNDYFDMFAGRYYPADSIGSGTVPLVTASNVNNGIKQLINIDPRFSRNCITIGKIGASTFYQGLPFCASSDVTVLKPKANFNAYIGLFMRTIIQLEGFKWSYGRQIRLNDSQKLRVRLPKDRKGEPNWNFMENYIKSLPYSSNLDFF